MLFSQLTTYLPPLTILLVTTTLYSFSLWPTIRPTWMTSCGYLSFCTWYDAFFSCSFMLSLEWHMFFFINEQYSTLTYTNYSLYIYSLILSWFYIWCILYKYVHKVMLLGHWVLLLMIWAISKLFAQWVYLCHMHQQYVGAPFPCILTSTYYHARQSVKWCHIVILIFSSLWLMSLRQQIWTLSFDGRLLLFIFFHICYCSAFILHLHNSVLVTAEQFSHFFLNCSMFSLLWLMKLCI